MKRFKESTGGEPLSLAQEDAALKEKARGMGKNLGYTNLPLATDANPEPFVKTLRGGYDNLLAREMKRLPANANHLADLELKASEEKVSGYQKRLEEARRNLHKATMEMAEQDTDDGSHISSGIIWTAIVIAAFCESFISYKSVGGLLDVGSNAVLWIILLGFTIIYIAVPKLLHWYYTEFLPERKYKVLLGLIPVVVFGVLYYALGYLRMHFMQMQTSLDVNTDPSAAPTFVASPWIYLSLSALFLLATYFLHSMLPSKEQSKNKISLAKKEKEIEKLQSEVERYEGLVSQAPDLGKNSLIRASQSNEGRKELYNQVNAMFHQSCGIFIDTNIQYRTDGLRPKAFDVQIEDLKDIYNNQ